MTDDGSSKEKYPDDSHSGYNDAELTPEQPDSNSGQARDDEPAQELSQDREATQQFSTNPDDYDNQQYPQQSVPLSPNYQLARARVIARFAGIDSAAALDWFERQSKRASPQCSRKHGAHARTGSQCRESAAAVGACNVGGQ